MTFHLVRLRAQHSSPVDYSAGDGVGIGYGLVEFGDGYGDADGDGDSYDAQYEHRLYLEKEE